MEWLFTQPIPCWVEMGDFPKPRGGPNHPGHPIHSAASQLYHDPFPLQGEIIVCSGGDLGGHYTTPFVVHHVRPVPFVGEEPKQTIHYRIRHV